MNHEHQFFDESAATWDEDEGHRERNEKVAAAIRDAVSLDTEMAALDVGGGTGMLSLLLADEVGRVTVTDPSAGMIEVARRRIDEAGVGDRVSAEQLDLTGPAFDAWLGDAHGRFDIVWSSMAFHHVQEIDVLVARLVEVLAPGGVLAVADLDKDTEGHFHEHHADFAGHHGFDRDILAGTLVAAGFTDVTFGDVMTLQKEGRDFPVFLLTARNHRS